MIKKESRFYLTMIKICFLFFVINLTFGCRQRNESVVSAKIEKSNEYIYVVQNWQEVTDAQKADAISKVANALIVSLEKTLKDKPPGDYNNQQLTFEIIDYLKSKEPEIRLAVSKALDYLASEEKRLDRYGFNPTYLAPVGGLVYVGIGGEIGAKLSVGGSATLVVPFTVTRYEETNILSKERRHWWRYMPSMSVMIVKGGGAGIGGGASWRFGGGLIWGNMVEPRDFQGLAVALSQSAVLGTGIQVTFGGLLTKLSWKPEIWYLMGGFETGPKAGVEVHLNVGPALNIEKFVQVLVKTYVDSAKDDLPPLTKEQVDELEKNAAATRASSGANLRLTETENSEEPIPLETDVQTELKSLAESQGVEIVPLTEDPLEIFVKAED